MLTILLAFMLAQPVSHGNPVGQHQAISSDGRDQSDHNNNPTPPSAPLLTVSTNNAGDKSETDRGDGQTKSHQWSLSDKIAAGATIAAFLQFVALIATITTMRRFSKQQLRAYLCVSSGQISFTDSTFRFQVFIKNCGQTPAHEVRSWGTAESAVHPLPSPLKRPAPDLVRGSGIIPPDGEHQTASAAISITEIEAGVYHDPSKALYVYGECSYRDIFGDYHTLEYRLIFGGPAGVVKKLVEGGARGLLSMDMDGNKERDHGKHRPN